MKRILEKIPGFKYLNYIRIKYLLFKENRYSSDMFLKHFIKSLNRTSSSYEYEIMLAIHQIEKGLSCKTLRPFGKDKVYKIISIIYNIPTDGFVYNYAMNILAKYISVYEENNWNYKEEYLIVKKFLNNIGEYKKISVGSFELKYEDIKNDLNIDYLKFISSRHSIRNFSPKKLEDNEIEKAIEIAIKSPSACNRQMCKIYYVDSKENANIIKSKAQGLGLFDLENVNYFIVTHDMSSCLFVGEKDQGLFNAGLFSMNFVNGLHSMGIGSCFIQFGNYHKDEIEIKKRLKISDSERIAVIIVAGHYDSISKIPCSSRKSIEDIYKKI